ncbi:MAG: histidine kinase [Fulvivirga sp.]|uniref:sensor histidine kinase n=1 Tax=Fulvivirga sp. TaxID=1931237 RepID=UPI0032ED8071
MKIGGITFKEVYVRWIGILILSYIMMLIHGIDEGQTALEKYFTSFIFTATYWNAAFAMFMYFRRKFPQIRQTPKRLLITFVSLVSFMTVADPILCSIFNFNQDQDIFSFSYLAGNAVINVITASVVGSVYENVYFFEQWKNSIRLNEELKNQQIRTQFEVLQNQMSPHFLFNSLNTLTTLIAEDQNLAVNFTEKLSEVYRYILQNKEKELVPLEDELAFVRAYIFLLQMRYPENLSVDIRVADNYLEKSIAPLTLQMLVENSIKHNIISKAHPLHIEIYTENGKSLIVKNNLQEKKSIEKSTKTGLQNIRKRYAYFGDYNIDVIVTHGNYMVAVPLLNVVSEKSLVSA